MFVINYGKRVKTVSFDCRATMVRERLHNSINEKQRDNRIIRVSKSENKTFCNVCNIFIQCNSNARLALSAHARTSRRHKDLSGLRDPNRKNDEI